MRRIAIAILIFVLALPASAAAQRNEDGVYVDPDSPTSKEYAVPTEEARSDASGGGGGSSAGGDAEGGGAEAPLFGMGVDRESGRDGSGGTGPDGDAAGAMRSADPSSVDSDSAGNITSAGSGDDGGLSTGLVIGGIALVVLLVGGGLAYALKRRDGWTSPLSRGAS